MNKKEQHQFERLERLLEAERELSEKAMIHYREMLFEVVELRLKLERIQKVLHGQDD